jgi:DNA-binding NarL/FixJ family response regulator
VAHTSLDRLSNRQRNVLGLVCKGFHNSEIAVHVGLSPRLVKECVSQLLLIFDVSNRTELVGLLALEYSEFPRGSGQSDGPPGPCTP